MNLEFCWSNARQPARQKIDEVLRFGEDQLALAVAFCTGAGVQILSRHISNLNRPESFVVVSSKKPTNLRALGGLDERIPERIYVHYGGTAPREIQATPFNTPLMHSKVIYARNGNECKLWVGSHNLTASATIGMNYEGAMLLTGDADEPQFRDALQHLLHCRSRSLPFHPSMMVEDDDDAERQNILNIHAESEVEIEQTPCFVHLCLPNSSNDREVNPGDKVILYLYPKGSLKGRLDPTKAKAVYEGQQTSKDFTQIHPTAPGIPAAWQDADYIIEWNDSVYQMLPARTPKADTTTQVVLRFERRNDDIKKDLFLEKKPETKVAIETDESRLTGIDDDMVQFLRPRRRRDGSLPFKEAVQYGKAVKLIAEDANRYQDDHVKPALESFYDAELIATGRVGDDEETKYIYQTKYRYRS